MSAPAELVLTGGRVLTLDPIGTVCEAVAVRGGRIVATGATREIREHVGPRTDVVDLAGKTLLPGINDSHAHVGWWAISQLPGSLDVTPAVTPTIARIRDAVRAAAARTPPGEWIVGIGWDANRLEECRADRARAPRREDLDDVAPDHPVVLTHRSGHAMWLNSEALRRAGIEARTAVPAGNEIVIDPDTGLPSGVLRELGATGIVSRCMGPPDPNAVKEALAAAIQRLHRFGITSFTEPALSPGDADRSFAGAYVDAYADLCREGRLEARVSVLRFMHSGGATAARDVAAGLAAAVDPGVDDARLRIAGVKIFADGVVSGRTAWMHESYTDGGRGSLVLAGDTDSARTAELRAAVRVAHAAGAQVGIHAIGDAAIDASVSAIAAAAEAHPRRDHRHYVIHGTLASRAALALMAAAEIGLNTQPMIMVRNNAGLRDAIGAERASRTSPVRSALDVGISVAFSSDIPMVVRPDWRKSVAAATTREDELSGEEIGRGQTIDLTSALRAVTTAGARQDFAEAVKGSIEPGKYADLCVLEGDLLAIAPRELPELDVAMTVVDGKVVYEQSNEGRLT